jgi:hypothetical protein
MRKIKILMEWGCYPFWNERGGNFSGEDLPVTDALKDEFTRLDDFFQNLLDGNDPKGSGFSSKSEAATFARDLITAVERLRVELGDQYEVTFDNALWQIAIDDPYD